VPEPLSPNASNADPTRLERQPRYDHDVQELRRITIDPEVMGGKPCIRGMRVTVGMIVESIAAGRTIEGLLADFPYLEEPDIREALAFAASLAQGTRGPPGQLMDAAPDRHEPDAPLGASSGSRWS
jgi:uncharacterized protein (DUF433 family)